MRPDAWLKPLFTWRAAVASEHGPGSPVTRHVLLTLSLHMSEKGDSCFPSIRLLMVETGLSNRTVISHLEAAAEAGWIERRDRKQEGQGWRSVEYRATVPTEVRKAIIAAQRAAEDAVDKPVDKASERGEPRSPPLADVVNITTDAVNLTAEGGERRSPEDVINSTKRTRAASPPPAKRVPLPADFSISAQNRLWSAENNLPPPYVDQQLEAFKDDARSNRRLHQDWDAAFRQWLRKQPQFDRNAPHPMKASKGEGVGADRRCVWPRRDALDRCTATVDQDAEGSWIGRGMWVCSGHVKDHLERAERRPRGSGEVRP